MTRSAPAAAEAASGALPDAVPSQFIFKLAPASFRPYLQLARIDRPIGWWLLLLPCWQSSALAASVEGKGLYFWHLLLFLIGAIAMRGAGSTYNDLVDREIDAKVERTRGRPLPSGRVSPEGAKLFLVAQALVGLAVLLAFNAFSILLGLASLGFVAIYPFMKRVTSWPQAVLGLAFAYGGLMGWAAVFGALAWPAVLLYASAIFWTIGYDTIYALQDVRDDSIAGIKSTARFFGQNVRAGVSVLYLASVLAAEAALLTSHAGVLAHLGLFGFAAHLVWQTRRVDPHDGAMALRLFRANRDAGLIFFAGLAAQAAFNSL